MSLLLLPAVYASTMVAFTAMRKLKLEKFLKPHQVTIAVAVGLSVLVPMLAFTGKLDMNPGKMHALVLFLEGLILSFAIRQRNEFDSKDFLWVASVLGIMCALAAFNTVECDRYASLVLGLVSALHLFLGVSSLRGTDDSKKRLGALWTVLGLWGILAVWFCESTETMNLVYTLAGFGVLLIAKINHPLLGDTLSPETTTVDPESTAWRM